jgi:hypothetical protein
MELPRIDMSFDAIVNNLVWIVIGTALTEAWRRYRGLAQTKKKTVTFWVLTPATFLALLVFASSFRPPGRPPQIHFRSQGWDLKPGAAAFYRQDLVNRGGSAAVGLTREHFFEFVDWDPFLDNDINAEAVIRHEDGIFKELKERMDKRKIRHPTQLPIDSPVAFNLRGPVIKETDFVQGALRRDNKRLMVAVLMRYYDGAGVTYEAELCRYISSAKAVASCLGHNKE